MNCMRPSKCVGNTCGSSSSSGITDAVDVGGQLAQNTQSAQICPATRF
jgi:hypothetical protein